jgi:hypothetical protein
MFIVLFLVAAVWAENNCTSNTTRLLRCLEFQTQASQVENCTEKQQAACDCVSCFATENNSCGNSSWDLHYSSCLVECEIQCLTSSSSFQPEDSMAVAWAALGTLLIMMGCWVGLEALKVICPLSCCRKPLENNLPKEFSPGSEESSTLPDSNGNSISPGSKMENSSYSDQETV